MSISENLADIKMKISESAKKTNRALDDITLIGVTKTIDTGRISELLDLGVSNLGENRVQELLEKYDVLGERPIWHLIGHLQTNKVKYIVEKVDLIHSVDSIRLAEEINKRCFAIKKVMDILIEVNIAQEESKEGIAPNKVLEFYQELRNFSNIRVKGLMTVAPFVEDAEENRESFSKMRKLLIDIMNEKGNNKDIRLLSMGMTNDYQVAIEEGSNMVRIGTGIFGKR